MKELLKNKTLWIAALGYFVDLYDLVLYGVVRIQSLRALQIPEDQFTTVGALLLNYQMAGMLAGGLAWGMLGDKRGRRAALFGSIFIYSVATFLNAFVQTVPQYAALRFLAGFGLAGELGAAITLVSEILPTKIRGMGAAIVASVGFMGAAISSVVAQYLTWSNAYLSGGILGFLLLFARLGIPESSVFTLARTKNPQSHWGSLKILFLKPTHLSKLLLCLLVGIPIWYVAGILSYFAPEFAKSFNVRGEVTAGTAIMAGYMGSILGDIACGLLSQKLKSRKRAILIFLLLGGSIAVGHHYFMGGVSAAVFYWVRFAIGFGNGYVALLVAWVAELFGTNIRATATTLVPNLMRASVIPLTMGMNAISPSFGLPHASIFLGVLCFSAALFALWGLEETFHRKIDFI